MKSITSLPEWQALVEHQQDIAKHQMRSWFDTDPERFTKYSVRYEDILFDYSRNRINEQTIPLLSRLADRLQLREKIEAIFRGDVINNTEARPVLHAALRDNTNTPVQVNGEDIKPMIAKTRERLKATVEKIQNGEWRGMTGQPIRYIINIGIGGSYLGPMMGVHALKDYAVNQLNFFFVSTIDRDLLQEVFNQIDPENSLFIVSSKTFTTIETMTNAQSALEWMQNHLGNHQDVIKHHFIAVTQAIDKAQVKGFPQEHIFPLWEWVGGRYSIWSAIGLPLMLMLGTKQFDAFLAGAHAMDEHFRKTPFERNLPMLMALLGIWYTNFFDAKASAIIPYSYRLRYFISYLQQAEMESNGKSVNRRGEDIDYPTGPIIFGEEGCNGQHTYHQLLHQGRHLIPVDFILIGQTRHPADAHHEILFASCLSQAQALMRGKTYEEALAECAARKLDKMQAETLARHQVIPGNRPSNILLLRELSPRSLGALLALYEHKIFVEGMVWDINSFDQWGVELGKQLLPKILRQVRGLGEVETGDCLEELINQVRQKREYA